MFGNLQHDIDSESIAKQFYERFKIEHTRFVLTICQNSPTLDTVECEHFVSNLLNKLMFMYFLQKKGFFEQNPLYFTHQLRSCLQQEKKNTFYPLVLHTLLYENIGYVFFSPLHTSNQFKWHVPDEAFVPLFSFFETYQWQLEKTASLTTRTLTPAILGYIFEQYINQKDMGAYYTREDVTDYIAQYTIIPTLVEQLSVRLPHLTTPSSALWQHVRAHPDRYIYTAIRYVEQQPTESHHEYILRRKYYMTLHQQISSGKISTINDFVTYNLNIHLFALDMIATMTTSAHVDLCYQHLQRITILDPTCGSGAFLFAALRTLLPLYEACQQHTHASMSQRSRYQTLTFIMQHNLFGLDIMAEATEICRLRLLLTLIASTDNNINLTTLPDLHSQVRTGNALMAVQHAQQASWSSTFPQIFTTGGFHIILGNPPYVEFSEKNLPYNVHTFSTRSCANLYTCIIERSRDLLAPHGRQGMILPIAAFSTRNMQPFLHAFRRWFPLSWLAFFHFRPAMLFSGGKVANIPTAIYLAKVNAPEQRFSTPLLKWTQDQRPFLFQQLIYQPITAPLDPANPHYYPKFGHACDNSIMLKLQTHSVVRSYLSSTTNHNTMSYRSAGGLYWKVFVNFPWPYETTSNKQCSFQLDYDRDVFVALYNSSLFWWYYTVTCDTFNLKDYMLFGFRFTYPHEESIIVELRRQCQLLMQDFRKHARHLKRGTTDSYTVYAKKSKPIIDTIDTILAKHYGLSNEELTYILNYDSKYRLGADFNTVSLLREPTSFDLSGQQSIKEKEPEPL